MKTNLTIALLFSVFACNAQSWELIKKIPLDQEISTVSVDSKGMSYVGTTQGNIIRYDSLGQEDEYFSQLNNSTVSIIQAWNRLKVFSFFREQQSISILDRFTATPRNVNLRDFGLQYASLFAPGVDNSYWALSTEFKELIKYDDQNLNVLFRIVLPSNMALTEATYLRAFKNLLILTDQASGLWFFDQYGVLQGNVNISGSSEVQIHENQVIVFDGSQITYINPFTLEIIGRRKAPKGAFRSVVIIGTRYFFFTRNTIEIYQFN
ncbi:hypothetical protein [Marinoscillum sp. MHG1-6]|uniref:hypothetical protein n=1 Tax=Marinoscillum sp. MHG1-6 TaxID=2959627 RepID=UPI0021579A03|nr:hypothetical protein [Marinoscillum sp. MHG1-6]